VRASLFSPWLQHSCSGDGRLTLRLEGVEASDHTQPISPSGDQFVLARGDQKAVAVGVGGGLRGYWVGDEPVLDGYGLDELCSSGRGQLLAPWPNRIQDGSYEFDRRTYQLALDEPERRNAIHGLVRWAAWTVVEREDDRVALEHRLHPSPGYPFTLDLRVEHSIGDQGLTVRFEATNAGTAACPYGVGAHPYLSGGNGLVDELELRVPARTALVSDERSIPVDQTSVDGTELDFRSARPIGSVRLDHCFTDLDRDDDGRARAELGGRATLWVDESYPYLMVFTGDGLADVSRRSLAVEPMTCAPNAFRSGDGLIRLEPGETHSGSWGIVPLTG
jgi:aldose 1-epimerase